MEKVKVGVFGVGRGTSLSEFFKVSENAEIVAVCDKWEDGLNRFRKQMSKSNIACFTSFDAFIEHDMDAVVLANYANEHARFAMTCLKKGKHVFSEVLPVQTMQEAVELVETAENSDRIYAYGENYCFMPAPREMRELYRQGVLGEFTYGEGEYMHNCESIWPQITQGDPDHWRNNMYANFYCTHSIGPLIHITGLRPVKVTGFELPFDARMARCGAKAGACGIEMITLENGAVIKSVHGNASRNSIWYSIYGSKGRMESAREDAQNGDFTRIYRNCDEYEGQNNGEVITYEPTDNLAEKAKAFGHGSSDFYTMYNFIEKIRGNQNADVIGVYEALDMFLPGMFAYRSVLNGGIPMEIPNLRNKAERDLWRHDTMCTDPKAAGNQLIPSYSKGNPVIEEAIYAGIRDTWKHSLEETK